MQAKKVIGYVRVSTDEQALGPEAQREALRRWCDAEGFQLAAVFEDIGVSGGVELDGRPGLMAALDALRDEDADILLAMKRDRISRDVLTAAMVERLAEREGAQVCCTDGAGNGSTPEAQAMRGMLDVFAQYERAVIRARTRAAMAIKKARGERVGSIPYGFQVGDDGKALIECPEEQDVLGMVLTLRGQGKSIRQIVKLLAEHGIRSRSGKAFSISQVGRFVQRQVEEVTA